MSGKGHLTRYLLIAAAVAGATLLLFTRTDACTQGVRSGLTLCAVVVIPSLFPFMVLCEFVNLSGLSVAVGRGLSPVTRRLFGLSGNAGAAILMAFVGGYPVGARAARSLYVAGEISKRDAQHMLCFCVNAGPAFIVGAVGAGMLNSAAAGWILLAVHAAASLIAGVLFGLIRRLSGGDDGGRLEPTSGKSHTRMSLPDAFVIATANAASGMFGICAFVVLFSAVMGVLYSFEPIATLPTLQAALVCALEVTTGCGELVKNSAGMVWIAAALGWSGVCVLCQVLTSAGEIRMPLYKLVLSRGVVAWLSYLLMKTVLRFIPDVEAVLSNNVLPLPRPSSVSVPASAALLATCGAFLMSLAMRQSTAHDGRNAGYSRQTVLK